MQTTKKHPSKIEIRESIPTSLGLIAILVLAIGYSLYEKDKYVAQFGAPVYWLLVACIFSYLVYKLFVLARRKVIMFVSNQGVYHQDLGLMKWNDILSIKWTRKSGGDHDGVFFLFQTVQSNIPFEISISGLDISERSFIRLIRKFKDYNIYEVIHNEL